MVWIPVQSEAGGPPPARLAARGAVPGRSELPSCHLSLGSGGAKPDLFLMTAEAERHRPPVPQSGRASTAQARPSTSLAVSIHICALILGAGALYFGRDFFLPIVLACLVALTLIPIVRWLARHGIPAAASAVGLVILLAGSLSVGVYVLSGPALKWVQDAPTVGAQVERKLQALRGSVEAVAEASRRAEQLSRATTGSDVTEVVVKEPGFLSTETSSLWSGITTAAITLLLVLFVLASGDMVYEKIIRIVPSFSDKKTALKIVHDLEASISRYLLTVTLINAGLGVAIGSAMWALGMPNPELFGVAGACLNFLPYLGAIIGIIVTAVVAFVTLDPLSAALLPPLTYFVLNTLEGNIVTPLVLGRRLELNTVAIFVGVAFWGWIWGLVGVLIAVPLLVVLKAICDHLPSWRTLGELLSQTPPKSHEEEPDLNPVAKA